MSFSRRAILGFVDLLRGFRASLSNTRGGLEEVLESGFGYLSSRFRTNSVGLFWWNSVENRFEMDYALVEGTLMEGEEEIIVDSHSPLRDLVDRQTPVVVSARNPWIAFIPLLSDGELIGAIRLERRIPLPRGRALLTLGRITITDELERRQFPLLEDLADILSEKLQQFFQLESHRTKARYLQAGNEVGRAVVETPRLMEMLESVSTSIVKNLGVDRIRFYLVDASRTELKGYLGLQIPGRLINLEGEKYPLSPKINSLVDSVMGRGDEDYSVTAGGKVVYVPLLVGGKVIGTMAVDNLLSQQSIDQEQMEALRTLAGQIGMAILNARLFEDIEQQAITDGLTKLYVFRYFHQRLKEEIDRADRYSYSVALIMMDVDNFKNFNDSYGHLMGDKVLECLAQTIRTNIRRIDLAARYGGDEFILLLPEITEQEAWLMAARLQNNLKESTLTTPSGEEIQMRVTMGGALYATDAHNGRDLIEAADRALYWAKNNNRGDICFFRSVADKLERSA